jgi:hypothetical protein
LPILPSDAESPTGFLGALYKNCDLRKLKLTVEYFWQMSERFRLLYHLHNKRRALHGKLLV